MSENERRIETGRHLVNEYVQRVYGRNASVDEEGDDSCIINAITDILHYAVSCGHNIQRIANWSVRHVEVELEEEECEP